MASDITIDDLKTSLGLLDTGDEAIDQGVNARLQRALNAAVLTTQNAIGIEIPDFFDRDDIKERYQTAVLALAGTYYEYPISIGASNTYQVNPVYQSIVGQLRGAYALAVHSHQEDSEEEDDGQVNESGGIEDSN